MLSSNAAIIIMVVLLVIIIVVIIAYCYYPSSSDCCNDQKSCQKPCPRPPQKDKSSCSPPGTNEVGWDKWLNSRKSHGKSSPESEECR